MEACATALLHTPNAPSEFTKDELLIVITSTKVQSGWITYANSSKNNIFIY